jgi:hypothetical protein
LFDRKASLKCCAPFSLPILFPQSSSLMIVYNQQEY